MVPIQTWCNELKALVPQAFDIGKFSRVSQEWQRKGVTEDQMRGSAVLFKAWIEAHPGQPVIGWQVAQMRGIIDSALDLFGKGYSPNDVKEFVKLKKRDEFGGPGCPLRLCRHQHADMEGGIENFCIWPDSGR